MDLSALIFVAVAVAWAVYLVPKALRHHEESAAAPSVEGASDRLRVLARREPVDRRTSALVVPGRPAVPADVEVSAPAGDPQSSRPAPAGREAARPAARLAARRRLRVLLAILLAGVAVGVVAALGHLSWAWLAAPGGVLVAWLVACRLMVRRERAVGVPAHGARPAERRLPLVLPEPEVDEEPATDEIAAVTPEEDEAVEPEVADAAAPESPTPAPAPGPTAIAPAADAGWDPVPVTLPTYVAKEPAARRTVRTIDLDSTGVWTSGRSEVDSALAREAEAAARRENDGGRPGEAGQSGRRAAGS